MGLLFRMLGLGSFGLAVLLILGVAALSGLYLVDPAYYDDFFGDRDPDRRWVGQTLLHIGPAAAALLLGLSQFTLSRPARGDVAHRVFGLTYVLAVLCGALGAALILPRTLGGAANAAGFLILAMLWSGAALAGVTAAVQGDRLRHRAWMIRSYGLTLAGVTLRIQLGVLTGPMGWTFDDAYVVTAWSSWIPNLLAAEVVILWIAARPVGPKRSPRP